MVRVCEYRWWDLINFSLAAVQRFVRYEIQNRNTLRTQGFIFRICCLFIPNFLITNTITVLKILMKDLCDWKVEELTLKSAILKWEMGMYFSKMNWVINTFRWWICLQKCLISVAEYTYGILWPRGMICYVMIICLASSGSCKLTMASYKYNNLLIHTLYYTGRIAW